jgi:hypothetical protein
VYAMQWTSDYIRVWFFVRGSIPSDILNGNPNPSSWGLPFANMQGSCVIDQHFQGHKVILNNAFCGEYAGASSVWNSTLNSCATATGYATCSAYVAAVPGVYQNAWVETWTNIRERYKYLTRSQILEHQFHSHLPTARFFWQRDQHQRTIHRQPPTPPINNNHNHNLHPRSHNIPLSNV